MNSLLFITSSIRITTFEQSSAGCSTALLLCHRVVGRRCKPPLRWDELQLLTVPKLAQYTLDRFAQSLSKGVSWTGKRAVSFRKSLENARLICSSVALARNTTAGLKVGLGLGIAFYLNIEVA